MTQGMDPSKRRTTSLFGVCDRFTDRGRALPSRLTPCKQACFFICLFHIRISLGSVASGNSLCANYASYTHTLFLCVGLAAGAVHM